MVRNENFGDHKDRMKWTELLLLAHREDIQHIVQIAMRTDDERQPFGRPVRLLDEYGDVPALVEAFFDANHYPNVGLLGIRDLGRYRNVVIDPLVDHQFTHQEREAYFDNIADQIREHHDPTIWFCDPDTGIEPRSSAPKKEHVRQIELRQLFDAMQPGDFFAVYQNDWRAGGWLEDSINRFRRACGVLADAVMTLERRGVPAVILAAQKPTDLGYCREPG